MMNMQAMQQGPVMAQVMQQQPVNPMVAVPQGQPVLQQQQQQQQSQEKLDNISKVKSLIGPLRDCLGLTLKTAAHNLHQNSLVDIGTLKNVDVPPPRFDKSMEEFYSICDQIELHLNPISDDIAYFKFDNYGMFFLLKAREMESNKKMLNCITKKTSIECLNQGTSSQRYLNLAVAPTRTEPVPNQDINTLTYPQYLATVRLQVGFAKEIHDTLLAAAQNISTTD